MLVLEAAELVALEALLLVAVAEDATQEATSTAVLSETLLVVVALIGSDSEAAVDAITGSEEAAEALEGSAVLAALELSLAVEVAGTIDDGTSAEEVVEALATSLAEFVAVVAELSLGAGNELPAFPLATS